MNLQFGSIFYMKIQLLDCNMEAIFTLRLCNLKKQNYLRLYNVIFFHVKRRLGYTIQKLDF